jgi:hypothetical protein
LTDLYREVRKRRDGRKCSDEFAKTAKILNRHSCRPTDWALSCGQQRRRGR